MTAHDTVASHHVHVFTLGGTIAMQDTGGGARPTLDAAALLGEVGVTGVEVTGEAFRQVPSCALELGDLTALAARIDEVVQAGAEGVVVSQGTDTLAESAFALDLLCGVTAPVVVTGAMRHPSLPSADGPANLAAAIRTAATPAARRLGVLVAANDEVHAARHVRKSSTVSTAAFTSPATGPLGWLVEGRLHLHTTPAQPSPTLTLRRPPPPIAVVPAMLGDDLRMAAGVVEAGYAGAVVEAMGAGHVPPAGLEHLTRLAAEVPTVFASRVGAGPTLTATYGYPGSEQDLRDRGLIGAGWLDAAKARLLLALLLAADDDVAETFAAFGGG